MEKKYYDAPQMEIVKLQHSMSLLQDSLRQSSDSATVTGQGENATYSNSLAGEFFGGDDGGEDW